MLARWLIARWLPHTLTLVGMLGIVGGAHATPPDTLVALPRFPTEGTVNALIILVQFPDQPDAEGDWGSDPRTEWPHTWSLGPERRLPTWAEGDALLAPPGTPPETFAEGSVSAFYHTMSHGRFTLTGHVYPRVVHPRHAVGWYHAHRGADPNGAVRLAREVLTSSEVQAFVDGLDASAFDTIRNGTTEQTPDGLFDLVILLHRAPVLKGLRLGPEGQVLGGSSITSLGADPVERPGIDADFLSPDADAFGHAPVRLGGLRVVDNLVSGSGLTGYALSQKQAVRIIAHELGHRHFGPYHTCGNKISPDNDCLGIMGGSYLTLSAGDRIKLGWTEVVPVDLPVTGRLELRFPDALASGQVFRLRDGADRCGDVIVEARLWSNPWDAPPNPDRPDAPFYGNDDGDGYDLFLPQEGLYLYKAPVPGDPWCGGHRQPTYDYQFFSSLENNGLFRRLAPFDELANGSRPFRVGGTYRVAYAPGDAFLPFARPGFFYHRHARIDRMLSITNIRRDGDAFTAEVWMDHLTGPRSGDGFDAQAYPNPFADAVTVRVELEAAARLRVEVYDALGRRGPLLADGMHQAGEHRLTFEPDAHAAAGLYWARILVERDGTARAFALLLHRVR